MPDQIRWTGAGDDSLHSQMHIYPLLSKEMQVEEFVEKN